MKTPKLIALCLLALPIGFLPAPAQAQDPSGMASITGCKEGHAVPGYKRPGFELRAYAQFACGSSVYVWNSTDRTALVQQGTTVAYVASKYVFGAGTSDEENPADTQIFLQGIAQALQSRDASAMSTRRQLVRSCLASRGCRVEAWLHLAWTRIKRPSQIIESSDSTLRLFAHGVYYSAFVVDPPVRFRDLPLPSIKSTVLVVDGGGLSLAIVGRTCYVLGTDGKWTAAGASAVQSAAAIQ
jgi:hypothetical protein